MSKPWVLAGLLGVWLGGAGYADAPILRSPGLHVVSLQGTEARWLGPGGHPAWTVDGKALYVEAAHGPLDAPPLGPVYQVEARIGTARGLLAESPMGCVKVSPTGKFLAWLSVPADSKDAFVAIYTSGLKPVGTPHRLGPAGGACRDGFAWLSGADVLVYVLGAAADGDDPGIWQIDAATEERKRVAQGSGGDGLWPSPDGKCAAVRVGGLVSVVGLDPAWVVPQPAAPPVAPAETAAEPVAAPAAEPDQRVALVWAEHAGLQVRGAHWAASGRSLFLHVAGSQGAKVVQRDLAGKELSTVTLPRGVVSQLGWVANLALFVADGDRGRGLLAEDLSKGELKVLASAEPDVPLKLGEGWPAAAPAASPDGKRVAVSLGRTDRYGLANTDTVDATDTNVAGKVCPVVRRTRGVGPTGVVFRPAELAFAGMDAPVADSQLANATKPGTMRWKRPSPPRWVVLHHTGTRSDAISLASLTSSGSYRIAPHYEDVTPAEKLLPEPRTLGVHYLVYRDGTAVQLAEEEYLTRHAGAGQWAAGGPNYDFNSESIGIEIVGQGNDFTKEQVAKVGRLVADICRRRHIPLDHVSQRPFAPGVLYHRDFAGARGKPDPAGWPWADMMASAEQLLTGGH